MANKHLRMQPHHHDKRDDIWWYEEPKGFCIVSPQGLKSHFVIPWRAIRAALARKDKPKDA